MSSVFDSLYRELDRLCMDHLKGITLGDVTAQIVETQRSSRKECHGAISGDCPAWQKALEEEKSGKKD